MSAHRTESPFRLATLRLALIAIGLSAAMAVSVEAQSNWVTTDSSEYSGGDVITITGSGFAAGEALAVQVTHVDGSAEPGMGHQTVVLSAAADGSWTATWTIATGDRAGNEFSVQVAGATSPALRARFTRVARLNTDKRDYQPGETVVVSGADFTPGEKVVLQVLHLTGADEGGEGHEPFVANADGGGRVASAWYVNPDDSHGSTFRMTAVGESSGRAGSITFTDAVGTPPDGTADVVYGQLGSFATADLNKQPPPPDDHPGQPSPENLWAPGGVATDQDGNLYIADAGNNRVLFYLAGSTVAHRVYGQPDFISRLQGATATRLLAPEAVALDSHGNLYVADRNNNRVLFFEAGSTTASRSYGQRGSLIRNFINHNNPLFQPEADSLWAPFGIALDHEDNLYIVDTGNHRVVFYRNGDNTRPERIYGQPNEFSGAPNSPTRSANSLNRPFGVAVDKNGNLYVADENNHRVLFYLAGSTTATRLYGPPDFESASGGTTDHLLAGPEGVALDRQGNLYVADRGNNRVLFFPAGATTATHVYGHPDFTSNGPNQGGRSATTLNAVKSVSVDREGNLYVADVFNHRVLEYRRPPDLVAPAAAPTQTPPANAAGWNNTNVTVDWDWSDEDGGTGIDEDNCTLDTTSSGEGSAIALTAECQDFSGNTATASYSVKVDRTGPASATNQSPPANAAGWNTGDVTINWNWSDEPGGSGLDAGRCETSSTSSGEGNPVSATATCADLAGNIASEMYSVKVDKTGPVASPAQSPLANAAGWNNTDATVSWNWSDGSGSGVDAAKCTAISISTGLANAVTVTGSCADRAGNDAAASYSLRVDKTAPATSAILQVPPPNAAGWNSSDVAITWTWADTSSGVDASRCTTTGLSSGEGSAITATANCADLAGNSASSAVTLKVDKTAPTVSLLAGPADGQTYNLGSVPPVPNCSASDALAGLEDTCVVAGYNPALGTHTVTASAVDRAGNRSSVSITYTVSTVATGWTLSGFYAPVDMGGVWNVLKGGSTVPLKFEVFAGLTELTDTSIANVLRATEVSCSGGPSDEIEAVATGGTSLRYDTAAGQFVYNWQTPKRPGYCYVVTVSTADGSTLSANFRIR